MSNPVRDARWKAFVGQRVLVTEKGEGKLLLLSTLSPISLFVTKR
jgi:hypothetical protein